MVENFNVSPYFDDFNESKQFVRVLYKPGLAVQARELTQQQTIIDNQIKRFGNHIFKEGSKVSGGETFYNNKIKFIAIDSSFGGNPVVVTQFLGKTVTGGTSGAEGRVVHVNEPEGADPMLLFVEMLTGDSPTTSDAFAAGENIATSDGIAADVLNVDFFGDASIFSINEGIYYMEGFFVFVAAQTITLEKFTNTPSFRIGLTLVESVVTVNEDSSLLDPARNTPNFQGEGADRFKISLILETKSLAFTEDVDNAASQKFVELSRIEAGLVKGVVKYPIYSDLMNTMARRTFDESGDYTVRPFLINIQDDLGDDTKLEIAVEPGKAFVKGYEFETIATETFTIDKARDTEIQQNRDANAKYGNFVLVDNLQGAFDPTQVIEVTLHNDIITNIASQGALDTAEIGTAKLRMVTYHTGTGANLTYRLYLFDLNFPGNDSIVDVLSVWGSNFAGAVAADIETTEGQDVGGTILFSTSFNVGLFAMPADFVKTLAPPTLDTDYSAKRNFTSVSFTTGTASSALSGSNTFFGGTGALTDSIKREHYLAVITTLSNAGGTGLGVGDVIDFTSGSRSITLSGGDQIVTYDIDDAAFEADVDILCTVNLNVKPEKVKTPLTATVLAVALTLGVGDLAISDVYDLVEVRDTGNANAVVTSDFKFVSGMTDNLYDHGSIVEQPGAIGLVGPFDVDIKYFGHTGAGYFSVDSYAGVDFEDIPSHRLATGDIIRLGDVLDFRPRRTDGASTLDIDAGGADLVLPNTNINFDFEFYLAKFVNIVLENDLRFGIREGTPAISPTPPVPDQDSMILYELRLNPFTLDAEKDVNIRYIDNRRYTMRDIGRIFERVDRIEYYTALSLLEKATDELLITDGVGNELFKNGILVDSFRDHRIGEIEHPEYKAAIDAELKQCRPFAFQDFGKFTLNSGESDVVKTGGCVSLPFTEENMITQPLVSKSISLNPFSVAVWDGNCTIAPQTDQWVDTKTVPKVVDTTSGQGTQGSVAGKDIQDWPKYWPSFDSSNSIRDSQRQRELLNQYNALNIKPFWFQSAYSVGNIGDNNSVGRKIQSGLTNLATDTSVGLGFLYEQIRNMSKGETRIIESGHGNALTDINFVPFIRSQDISYAITGAKPNTRMYVFFDQIDVNAEVTPAGDTLGDPVHTDANGSASGVFALPNSDVLRFRTGQRMLKFTDSITDDDDSATSVAECPFFAQGLIQTREINVKSTRPITVKRAAPGDNRIITDPVQRDLSNANRSGDKSQFKDPVAQIFTVDTNAFPNGAYATGICLFFEAKDEQLPVSIELRPTVNGFPHASKAVPFSHVSLNPNQVSISTDGSIATEFTFPDPVFLEGGEYALVVQANSDKYKVFVAELGQNVIGTTQRIVTQPNSGALFKSQNATIWTPELDEDMAFIVKRAKFTTGVTGTAVFDVEVPVSDVPFDAFKVLNDTLIPPETVEDLSAKHRDETSGNLVPDFSPINEKIIENLTTRGILDSGKPPSFKIKKEIETQDDATSPLIDEERSSLIVFQNLINDSKVDENLPEAGLADAKYISRRVTLRDGFDATGLKVFVNAILPSGTDIAIYAKVLSKDDSTDLKDRGWTQLTRVGSTADISSGPDNVIEMEFEELDLSYDGFPTFKIWQVKLVMLSPTTSSVPRIEDFRAIAVS